VAYLRAGACDARAAPPPLDRATALFMRFHAYAPTRVDRVRTGWQLPSTVVRLGRLVGVIYASDRGSCGRERTFVHFMDDPPVLAADVDGTQLYVLGGCYRVTERGLEG
jgi:hypothetical protein